jgi:hypothetical protein
MVLTRFTLIPLLLILLGPTPSIAQTKAITQDGRPVILNPDGTWRYLDAPGTPNLGRTPNATAVVQGKRVPYKVWYDPAKWQLSKKRVNESSEYELNHVKGDGYAVIIAERIQVEANKTREIVLENARNWAPDAKLVSASQRLVNGARVEEIQINGTASGISFVYYGYVYSGKQGTVQVLTYTSQNLFDEFRTDFNELLSGYVVE